jgi:hypothetical protein
MSKVKVKEFNAEKEWNDFVWSLIQAERAWKKISDHFIKAGNADNILENWPQSVVRICRTTKFRYAIEDFARLCGQGGDIKEYFIKIKKGDLKNAK